MDNKVAMSFIDIFMLLFLQLYLAMAPPQIGITHDWKDLPEGAELIRIVDSQFEAFSSGHWQPIDVSSLQGRLVLGCFTYDCLSVFGAQSQRHDQLALILPEVNAIKAKQIISQECNQSSNSQCNITIIHDDASVYLKGYKGRS